MTTVGRVLLVAVDREDGTYVAHSDAPTLASQGESPHAALRAYAEALEVLIEKSDDREAGQ